MPHIPAPAPADERLRLESLEQLHILDTLPEVEFDDIVQLATSLCDTPIGLVSLIDRERQWFKACIGLTVDQTHRDLAFCAHAILRPDDLLEVSDARVDPRFKESALVLGPPYIVFYAGAPIVTPQGHALGTVCVIDTVPRQLSPRQRDGLQALARQTAALIRLRSLNTHREQQVHELTARLGDALQVNQQSREALQRIKRVSALGQLTASIAHDFNNLLQALSATLQLTHLQSQRPAKVEQLAETGLQAVAKGAQLVTHLLTFTRGEAIELQTLNVCERIGSLEPLMRQSAGPGITLLLDLAQRDSLVMCDSTQFDAAALNLLVNARDALQGEGLIEVSTQLVAMPADADLAEGDYVLLQVQDNGPGISADVAAQALEPFFSTKPLGVGTGLGLAQVHAMATAAGGTVRLSSRDGGGTCVSVFFKTLA